MDADAERRAASWIAWCKKCHDEWLAKTFTPQQLILGQMMLKDRGRLAWRELMDDPPKYLTTEQLADELLRDVQQQTPQEKAEFRKQLKKAFKPPKPPEDGTLALLRKHHIPVTRENYLRLAFLGNPPDELDGELEAELENLSATFARAARTLRLTKADKKMLREMGIRRR